ncbi:MAG: NADPH-dependent FMN reductase [Opitutales bacterium]
MSDILVICGTNRPGARSRIVADVLLEIYRAMGADVDSLDLADMPEGIFSTKAYQETPGAFKSLSDKVLAAGGLHVVTPEYNGALPGILKYFIDMLPFPESFEDRCVCFTGVSAGSSGAIRPIEMLTLIFNYRNGIVCPARVMMPSINNLIDETDELTDAKMRERLQKQAETFNAFVRKLKP